MFYAGAEVASYANRLCDDLRNAAAGICVPKHHVWAAVHNRAAAGAGNDDVLILLAILFRSC